MIRVIVADDDRVSSHLLCAILRANGYAPEPARDVPELFAACARPPAPAAILLDLHMPGGNGPDSIAHIRRTAGLAAVPLIVVSGSEDEAIRSECLRLGASAFVPKPVQPERLLASLRGAGGE